MMKQTLTDLKDPPTKDWEYKATELNETEM